jgi:hypothetical protein
MGDKLAPVALPDEFLDWLMDTGPAIALESAHPVFGSLRNDTACVGWSPQAAGSWDYDLDMRLPALDDWEPEAL